MKKNFFIITSFVLLLVNPQAYSQSISLRAGFEKDSLMIGEQTKFYFSVVKEKSTTVNFPLLSDTLTKNLEILRQFEIDTISTGNEVTLKQTYLVISFDTGQIYIDSYPFAIAVGDVRDTLYTTPVYIYVGMPEVDVNADFRDIKAPVNTPLSLREILPYALLSLLGVGILVAAVFIIKRLRRKEPVFVEKNITPPYIIALSELQKMLNEKIWEKVSIKEYYTLLSGIVRTYLEAQFNMPALESTTHEILPAFELKYGKNTDLRSKLEELLELSDLVKFAKEAPLPDENIRNINKAILFVELTKPEFKINNDNNSNDNNSNDNQLKSIEH